MCADMLADLEARVPGARRRSPTRPARPPGEAAAAALPAACSVAKAYASDAVVRAATTLIQVHAPGLHLGSTTHLFYWRSRRAAVR
jgi:alkylation response protein AidB-like acyl-CoA dehydrogenase